MSNQQTKTIQDWDTNTVFISDKLKEYFPQFHKRLIRKFAELDIPVRELKGTYDIWCRDYMPVQISERTVVGFNYNPDYLTQCNDYGLAYPHIDRLKWLTCKNARTIQADVWNTNQSQIPLTYIPSEIILDGGNIVVCDNCMVLTDKIIAENKNIPDIETRLRSVFGLEPVIIPWTPVGDDVFGHSDGMLKYQHHPKDRKPHVLISPLTKKDRSQLLEALCEKFYIDLVAFPEKFRKVQGFYKYAWAYINYLQVGNKILIPALDLSCDDHIRDIIQGYNEDCIVDNVEMREIVECGGALHCLTWNVKL